MIIIRNVFRLKFGKARVVLEITVPTLAAFEGSAPPLMGDKDWQANYQKIAALVESGEREIFTLVE